MKILPLPSYVLNDKVQRRICQDFFLIEKPEYPITARVFLSIADLSPLRTADGAKIPALPHPDRDRQNLGENPVSLSSPPEKPKRDKGNQAKHGREDKLRS